jgi:hypothetical protein
MRKFFTILSIALLTFCGKTFSQGLVINEMDYDQPGQDTSEFIELYNSSANAIDLGLYSIVFLNGNGNVFYDTVALPSFSLMPNDYFVICGFSNVSNCDLLLSGVTTQGFIQNGSPDAIAIVETANFNNIIDAVSYEGTVATAGYFETQGVSLLASDSASSNRPYLGLSRVPDGQDASNNSTDFIPKCITPGFTNGTSTNIDSTACLDPNSITKVRDNSWLKVYPNPSHGTVIVDFKKMNSSNASITVNNLLGKEIKKVILRGNESFYLLDLTTFQDGIYFISLKSDAGESTKRVVLKK